LNRWAFLLAAAGIVLIGCGGSGGGAGGGGGTTGGDPSINPTVFNTPGHVNVTYDTGAGRVPGSQTAVIRHFYLQDAIGLVETTLLSEMYLGLDKYTSQALVLDVPMGGFNPLLANRKFASFPLEILSFIVEQSNGSQIRYDDPNGPIFTDTFALGATAMPGRHTSIQIFLDDQTIFYDEFLQQVVFDRPRFETLNYDTFDNQINGFLSDFISFDISSVGSRPQLTSGQFATRVYFSGDQVALSLNPVVGGAAMEVLTPLAPPIEALVSPPQQNPFPADGTYTLRQPDPRDLTGVARLTALQGIWRPYIDSDLNRSLFLNVGQFFCVTLPRSADDGVHEILFVARNLAGQITDMYYGQADFVEVAPGLFDGTFSAWPIENIDDGSPVGEVTGTFTSVNTRSGIGSPAFKDIRTGTFAFDIGQILPSSFQTSGPFFVGRL
jgi:hypothetical protein